jgi:hypothetical protein
MWPLAFHELMAVDDHHEFIEQRLAEADFTPDPLGPRTVGACFLNCVLRGYAVDWATRNVPQGKVDRVLAALGLYHVRVQRVIPKELRDQYKGEVSVMA